MPVSQELETVALSEVVSAVDALPADTEEGLEADLEAVLVADEAAVWEVA